MAEAWDEKDRTDWRDGLKAIDELSQDINRKPFMQSSADERLAVLTRMAQNETKPEKPEETFFVELKSRVVDAYYTSEIGIKQEMDYKGNSYQTEYGGIRREGREMTATGPAGGAVVYVVSLDSRRRPLVGPPSSRRSC